MLAVDVAQGRARGVLLRDRISGKDERVDAGWILNCTGPWADRICQRSAVRTSKPMLGGVRGSHIVLPRFSGAPSAALYTEAADGRPVFVLPWNEQVLVGTTEVPDTGDPGKTAPSSEEIEYLLRTVAKLFPKAKISAHDIKYRVCRSAASAELAGDKRVGGDAAAFPARPHAGRRGATDLGDWRQTDHRRFARAGMRPQDRDRGRRSRSMVAMGPGQSLDPMLDQEVLEIARAGSVSEETARGMMEWHGQRAMDIARMALVSAELRAPICPHTSHIVAEVVEAYRKEFAVTLGDVLLRRVPVALGACWSESCSREAALRIGAVLGWNEQALGANLESFETERTAFLQKPSRGLAALEAAAD